MSQITTCPSCGTRFRVVADQLRISDGWVRCGQCQEVFDARSYLDAIIPVAPQSVEASAPARAVGSAAAVEPRAPALAPEASGTESGPSPVLVSPPAVVPPVVAVRPPLPMIPVPAPRAPVPQEAAAPGYELPAPTWADDFDFSDYQATPHEAVSPVDVPEASQEKSEQAVDPSALRAVEPLAAPPAPVVLQWDGPVEPGLGLDTPVPVPQAATEKEEPRWTHEPDLPGPALKQSDFPPLDVSVLPLPSHVSGPGGPSDAWSENADSSSLGAHEKLLKGERHGAHTVLTGVEAPASWATASGESVAESAERAAASADAELPAIAAEAVLSPAPLDAIESVAQKLAQAEAPSAWGAATAEDAAPAAFPFAPPDEVGPGSADAVQEFDFVRDARRKAWWQKPAVRVAMGAGVVVLPVALALQVALHERNALAAWQPSLRPGLEFMCTALQCQLGPRQQTGAMVVSGSSFAKGERERSYLLNLSIQNRASTPMGMPAVELTLTDAQDQAIARKVISAKALGAPVELAAGAEWSGAVPVTTDGLNLQVVGYRVLLFYP